MKRILKSFRTLIALLRLNKRIVCEESKAMGLSDFHDYKDTKEKEPWHMTKMICVRCGKEFII